jgi:hypothetical protein
VPILIWVSVGRGIDSNNFDMCLVACLRLQSPADGQIGKEFGKANVCATCKG